MRKIKHEYFTRYPKKYRKLKKIALENRLRDIDLKIHLINKNQINEQPVERMLDSLKRINLKNKKNLLAFLQMHVLKQTAKENLLLTEQLMQWAK